MPTSDFHQISDVLHVVEQMAPRSVLDVGVGFGKWGFLCREVLEVYKGRYDREQWSCRVEGIEIHEAYRNEIWSQLYDKVHIGDARSLLSTLGHYDLIICCDVIEHFTKEDGLSLLNNMISKCDALVLTSPRGYVQQGAAYDNVHETHRSGWGPQDFASFNHLYKDVGFTFLAVLATDPKVITRLKLLDPFAVIGTKRALKTALRMTCQRIRQALAWRNAT